MERDMTFAVWVKDLRRAADLTQLELADAVHVSVAAVKNWERGATVPFPAVLTALNYLAHERGLDPPPLVDRRRGPLVEGLERMAA